MHQKNTITLKSFNGTVSEELYFCHVHAQFIPTDATMALLESCGIDYEELDQQITEGIRQQFDLLKSQSALEEKHVIETVIIPLIPCNPDLIF
jgi:hypothetical protein